MNYQSHYQKLIQRARERGRPDGYAERHHSIPRHAGGSDDPENIIWLTAREHFVAHMLLAMGGSRKDWIAVTFFMGKCGSGDRYVNGRLYAAAAERSARFRSESLSGIKKGTMPTETRARISESKRGIDTLTPYQREELNAINRGRQQSDEHRKKRADALRGKPQRPEVVVARAQAMTGRKRTPEQCERIRLGRLYRSPVTQETRDKISAAGKGRKHSDETKEKMRSKAIEREALKRIAKARPLG